MNWLEADATSIGERGHASTVCPYRHNQVSRTRINGSHASFQAAPEDEPPAYGSINGTFETPATGNAERHNDTGSPSSPSEFPKRESPTSPSAGTSGPAHAKSAASTSNSSEAQLKAQLSEAHAQIQRLKDRLADQGLRQGNIGGGSGSTTTAQTHQAATEAGVPVQFVAGLCLISFLLAYLFF